MVLVGYEEMTTHQRERNYVMDEREYYREDIDTVECTKCGQAHLWCSEGLLEGMELGALSEAKVRLSSEGVETLMMVGQAAESLSGGLIEAWELAEKENISHLAIHDAQVLRDYGARITMIEQARKELNEDTFPRD
jgi:ferredoxin